MAYRNLFIDLDDTLWDIHHNGRECLEEVYHDYRFEKFYPSFEDYYAVFIPHNQHLWRLYRAGAIKKETLNIERFLMPLRPFGVEDSDYARRVGTDFLERTTHKTRLIEGSLELLDYLKPRYRMHILSNGFREVQYRKIENSGLKPYFGKIILSEDAGINKPHAEMFTYALKCTNSRRHETVMIGDSWEADIMGAYNSRIAQIWFNPQNEPPREFIPFHTVRSLLEIKEIL